MEEVMPGVIQLVHILLVAVGPAMLDQVGQVWQTG